MHGKVKVMGNVVEFQYVKTESQSLSKIKKISKEHYMNIETGEVYDYGHSDNRSDNIASIKRSFRNARDLINTNFKGGQNELMFTLTYAENMTDTQKLYKDMEKFIKKLKYKYGVIAYLSAIEPQGRGAWHAHMLVRFNEHEQIYIPNKDIAALWGHGYTKTKRLESVDNIGAYYTAYLTDIECTKDTHDMHGEHVIKDVEDEDGQSVKKKFIKGARLRLYPVGMQIFRHSRNLNNPEIREMTFGEFVKETGMSTPDYAVEIQIMDEDEKYQINRVIYAAFNTKRQQKTIEKREQNNDVDTGNRRISD